MVKKKDVQFISLTTIITLFILVFIEGAYQLISKYIIDIYLILGCAGLAFILFIVLNHGKLFKKKHYHVVRMTIIIFIALGVETFANYVIGETGVWISTVASLIVIYVLAWYGYIETHKLRAL
jgi:hypothetical protein